MFWLLLLEAPNSVCLYISHDTHPFGVSDVYCYLHFSPFGLLRVSLEKRRGWKDWNSHQIVLMYIFEIFTAIMTNHLALFGRIFIFFSIQL